MFLLASNRSELVAPSINDLQWWFAEPIDQRGQRFGSFKLPRLEIGQLYLGRIFGSQLSRLDPQQRGFDEIWIKHSRMPRRLLVRKHQAKRSIKSILSHASHSVGHGRQSFPTRIERNNQMLSTDRADKSA